MPVRDSLSFVRARRIDRFHAPHHHSNIVGAQLERLDVRVLPRRDVRTARARAARVIEDMKAITITMLTDGWSGHQKTHVVNK